MSTSTNPYADQYIDQMAKNFIHELKKIEIYDQQEGRQMFERLVNKHDKEFIDQYMEVQGKYTTPQNMTQFSNNNMMESMPGPKPTWIADGRFNKNVSNLANSLNNPYMAHTMGTKDPNNMDYSNVNIGFTNSRQNWFNEMPKTTSQAKPNILGLDKEHQLHYDIHANSRQ